MDHKCENEDNIQSNLKEVMRIIDDDCYAEISLDYQEHGKESMNNSDDETKYSNIFSKEELVSKNNKLKLLNSNNAKDKKIMKMVEKKIQKNLENKKVEEKINKVICKPEKKEVSLYDLIAKNEKTKNNQNNDKTHVNENVNMSNNINIKSLVEKLDINSQDFLPKNKRKGNF